MKTTFPLFLLPFLLCATASGQTWNGSNGDWNVASNWAGSMLPISSSGESRVLNGNVVLTSSGETFSFYLGGHPLWSAGLASLTIKDGGAFSSNASYIGMIGNGTLNVQANSSWTIRDLGQTYIGFSAGGIGAVNVTGGGSVSSAGPTYVGYGASSSGSIRISGQNSVWTLSGNGGMTLGYLNGGTGSLTLEDGGKLTSTQSSSWVILGGSGNGTLNLGSGGAAGRLEVTEVFGATGANVGKVNFNHNESAYTFQPRITQNNAVEQKGTGTTIITGANTYTGGTTVSGGKLVANNSTGSAFGTGSVLVNADTTLSGIGSFTGAATIHGVYAPGNSVGRLTSGALTVAAGGAYQWEINKADGTAGTTAGGWDLAQVNGQLTFAPGATINIVSLGLDNLAGAATGFDENLSYLWNIATATGGISGAENVTLDASGFQNPHNGIFGLSVSGNNLRLTYTPVPEASTACFAVVATFALCARRRLRRKSPLS